MRRLLCLSTYPRSDASVRQRFLQYVPALEAEGWSVRFESIVGERLFRIKNRGGLWQFPKAVLLIGGLLRRLAVLATVPSYDCVWVQREAFPFFTPFVEKLVVRLARGLMVLDFDDALHTPPVGGFDWRSPFRDRGRYGEVVALAETVLVGSEELAAYARAHNGSVRVVPTSVDTLRGLAAARSGTGRVTIGWIGSWNTAPELEILREVLPVVSAAADIEVLYAGAANARLYLPEGVPGEARPWGLDEEDAFFSSIDIGVMPLVDTPWNRGKCAFKIIQYMAAGVPFVASTVGANAAITLESQAGFLADTPEQWSSCLTRLVLDPALRLRMGSAGRIWAMAHFDFRVHVPAVVAAVEGRGTERA